MCVLKKKFYSTNSRRCCYSWLDLGVPQASFKANNCSASRAAMHTKLNSSIVWQKINPEACVCVVSFPYTSSAPSPLNKTPVPRNSMSSPLQSYTYNKYPLGTLKAVRSICGSRLSSVHPAIVTVVSYPSNKPLIIIFNVSHTDVFIYT